MAKKSAKPTPRHVEPEDENQDNEEQEAVEATEPKDEAPQARRGRGPVANGTISKVEAVRRALAAGKQSPEEGVSYIEEKFGIGMDRQHFSSVKSQLKKKEGSGEAPEGRLDRKPREAAAPMESRAAAPQTAPVAGDMVDDLAAVKHLVQKLGADQVRKIVGLFE